MYLAEITIENFRSFGEGDERFNLSLRPGLTAVVGENDAGKSALIDALRFTLGTTDQEWYRLEDTDFHVQGTSRASEIRIVCKFDGLSPHDMGTYAEYLTYAENAGDPPVVFVNWTAKDTREIRRGRPYRRVDVHSGRDGCGPSIATEVRDLLRATYMRPLRDAEDALSAGRGSRLAQVLRYSELIKTGEDKYDPKKLLVKQELSVLGIGNLVKDLLKEQKGVVSTREEIDKNLRELSLREENLKSKINVSGTTDSEQARLRELLEQLDLRLGGDGRLGLGSNNILFIACELLLLAQESDEFKLLLIEEPEAHLHAQRQLRGMTFLQTQAKKRGIQIIVTTHSPNLASTIHLNNIVMISNNCAFSMAEGLTMLDPPDYRFLQRFLDVTKANLFFARGVMIVEGDAENILLPTLARLIGRDFTEYGVSIVNVGTVGLRRYARIFQRKNSGAPQLGVPVACVTDLDVMPDCAGEITGKNLPTEGQLGAIGLAEKRKALNERASGQQVETFVADKWTLEYDLAYFGLAKHVYLSAQLAKKDATIDTAKLDYQKGKARKAFVALRAEAQKFVDEGKSCGCQLKEVLAAMVYAQFTIGNASKPIAAQYLAELLERIDSSHRLSSVQWRALFPKYVTEAIDYVTVGNSAAENHNKE